MCARLLASLALVLSLAACGEDRPASSSQAGGASATKAEAARVPRREQEEGLARCGEVLARMEGPEAAPTFSRLMRECGGMFAHRRCRDALSAEPFSREGVAESCRADYCDELRPAPSFCTTDMPTDAEFLEQFARFSRTVLRRDLRRLMDREGADEIADLFADLVETQAALE